MIGENKLWRDILAPEYEHVTKNIFPKLDGKLYQPSKPDIFKAYQLCPYETVKVVIVGQDPYYTKGTPTGLAFATGDNTIPPTLLNIFKEVEFCVGGFIDRSKTDLTGWAKQGVLLLNTILTVEPGKPLSHAGLGWDQITHRTIQVLGSRDTPAVFMLWGREAQKLAMYVRDHHLVLTAMHPSPAAAGKSSLRPFAGCRHFKKANDWLQEKGREPILWEKL